MKKALHWLDQRTGYKKLVDEALYENVPGGARWRYVWGSTLMFTFSMLVITGIFLWMGYSPSSQTAWESVFYIQYDMHWGWVLRGIHHFAAQAMIVLLVLHLMQVVIDGAYKAPREVNYWFGIGLLLITLGLSLTGYLLPWDQKGYWATKVATNIASTTPVIGDQIQRVLVGGPEYGHHTLTRFFALHAGVLPGSLVLLVAWHIYLFRRHGIKSKQPHKQADSHFWPDQVLKDVVACLAVLIAVLFLVARHHGADLGPPADPTEQFSAARPEWYFLFLFQFLKLFSGPYAILGSIVFPTLGLILLSLFPIFGNWKFGHRFNLGFTTIVILGAGWLTYAAVQQDRHDAHYQAAVRENDRKFELVRDLAQAKGGIPKLGALSMLEGPKLFAQNCAACHRYDGHNGLGHELSESPHASDLKGFGSRNWLQGLLDPNQIQSPRYFGATHFAHPDVGQKKGKMIEFVTETVAQYNPAQKAELQKVITALSAEAKLRAQHDLDLKDAGVIEEGRKLFADSGLSCTDCHGFRGSDTGKGPDLTDYASRAWMIAFIQNPAHEKNPKFYPATNDKMPAFEKKLDPKSIELIVDFLRGE